MLKFTKGFINNTDATIATDYKKINDVQKINEIRKKLHPDINFNVEKKEEDKIIAPQVIDYQSRINAMKNINKG